MGLATAFFISLAAVLLLGLSAARKARGGAADYYTASRSMPPALVGLSAVATNNSGYMFIGLIGYTYAVGVQSVWLMVGWIVGDYIGSRLAHRRLREEAERVQGKGLIGVLARWGGQHARTWQAVVALVGGLFLIIYAAAQLAAGGKALDGMLGIPPAAGMVMVAFGVMVYSFAGGIRASIWTDVLQSVMMLLSMFVLLAVALQGLGGVQVVWAGLGDIPGFLSPMPTGLDWAGWSAPLAFVVGWMFAGSGALGQPHIVSRFLTLKDSRAMPRVRLYYFSYFALFYCLSTTVGLLSRLYFPGQADFDPELALPTMARDLLPPWLAGFFLAGLFAATMSTADSLLLSCSSALSQELPRQPLRSAWHVRGITALVTSAALAVGLLSEQSVFALVVWAWGTLGAAFVPLLLLKIAGAPLGSAAMVVTSLAGVLATVLWKFYGFPATVYEGAVGLLWGLCVGGLLWGFTRMGGDRQSSP